MSVRDLLSHLAPIKSKLSGFLQKGNMKRGIRRSVLVAEGLRERFEPARALGDSEEGAGGRRRRGARAQTLQ